MGWTSVDVTVFHFDYEITDRIYPDATQIQVGVGARVYDVVGRMVQTLGDGFAEPGPHTVDWGGRNCSGARVAGGVYFSRLEAPGITQKRRMVLLK